MNFNKLATGRSNSLAPDGTYKGLIKTAEMKTKKDGTSQYLNLYIQLRDAEGNKVGGIFDIFTDSDNSFMQYKLRRLLEACDIDFGDEDFELTDLLQILTDKEIELDITSEESAGYAPKNVLDTTVGEMYYPCSIAEMIEEKPVKAKKIAKTEEPAVEEDKDDMFE